MNDELDVPNRKPGRPRTKLRNPILSAEQVDNLLTPVQKMAAEQREAERERGIERRRADKKAKQFEAIETMEQLWEHNRTLLSEAELIELREKDQRTQDLWNWIDLLLEGSSIANDPDWPSMESGIAAVEAHVKNFGVCNPEIALIKGYWKLPLYETLKGGTETFAKYGLFIGLPERRVLQLREMFPTKQNKTQPGNGYTTLRCACDAMTGRESVPLSIADRYRELGKKFLCSRCRDLESKSRAQSTMYGGSR